MQEHSFALVMFWFGAKSIWIFFLFFPFFILKVQKKKVRKTVIVLRLSE